MKTRIGVNLVTGLLLTSTLSVAPSDVVLGADSDDGSETWATSYEMTVTPEGRFFGTSLYGAEMLDCSGQ